MPAAQPKSLTFADLKASLKELGTTVLFPDLHSRLPYPLQALAIALQTQYVVQPLGIVRQERNRASDYHVTGSSLATDLHIKENSTALQELGNLLSKGTTTIAGFTGEMLETLAKHDPLFTTLFFDAIVQVQPGETPDVTIGEYAYKVQYKAVKFPKPNDAVQLNVQQQTQYLAVVTRLLELDAQEIMEVANEQTRSQILINQHAAAKAIAQNYYIFTLWNILTQLFPLKHESTPPAS